MRRDEPSVPWPFGIPATPDQDRDASFLWVRYCIGDELDPDQVIEVKAPGPFRIDNSLRDEIQAVLPAALHADDLRETQIRPMGVGEPYLIDVWVTGILVGLATHAIWDQWKSLATKIGRPVSRTESNAGEFDADQLRKQTAMAEQQLLGNAKGLAMQHYPTLQGVLTPLSTTIKQLRSASSFSGTAVLRDEGGSTFTVIMDYDLHGWTMDQITRSYPES
jgi:hypothetical protein